MRKFTKNLSKPEIKIYPQLDSVCSNATYSQAIENVLYDGEYIPLILLGNNGIFVFLGYECVFSSDEFLKRIDKIRKTFFLPKGTYFFAISDTEEKSYLVNDEKTREILPISNVLTAFCNLYLSTLVPEYALLSNSVTTLLDRITIEEYDLGMSLDDDDQEIRKKITNSQLDYVKNCISKRQEQTNLKQEEDGTKYIKKRTFSKLMGYSTGEAWFRISEEDPVKTLFITAFTGFLGLHHLMRGNFGKFLFYLVTAGGIGVSYIADVINLVLGDYSYMQANYVEGELGLERTKEKIYVEKVESPQRWLLIPISIIIAILWVMVVKEAWIFIVDTTNTALFDAMYQSILETNL